MVKKVGIKNEDRNKDIILEEEEDEEMYKAEPKAKEASMGVPRGNLAKPTKTR